MSSTGRRPGSSSCLGLHVEPRPYVSQSLLDRSVWYRAVLRFPSASSVLSRNFNCRDLVPQELDPRKELVSDACSTSDGFSRPATQRALPLSSGANEVLLVVGGFGSQQSPIDVVEKYDPKTQEWSFLPVSKGRSVVGESSVTDPRLSSAALTVEKPVTAWCSLQRGLHTVGAHGQLLRLGH